MDRSDVLEFVLETLRNLLQVEFQDEGLSQEQVTHTTPLMGYGAILNSMSLVSLIVEVEQRLNDEQGIEITIADERAMSMQRSPFRTVDRLVDYICLLEKERRNG